MGRESGARCARPGIRLGKRWASPQVNDSFSVQGPVTMWCREPRREPLRFARNLPGAAPERSSARDQFPEATPMSITRGCVRPQGSARLAATLPTVAHRGDRRES